MESTYTGSTAKGKGERNMYDRRNGGSWTQIEAHLFDVTYGDQEHVIEVQVNGGEFTPEEAET